MNRGEVIAQGPPEDIRTDPLVVEAYMGRGRTAAKARLLSTTGEPIEGVDQ